MHADLVGQGHERLADRAVVVGPPAEPLQQSERDHAADVAGFQPHEHLHEQVDTHDSSRCSSQTSVSSISAMNPLAPRTEEPQRSTSAAAMIAGSSAVGNSPS